MNDGIHNIHNVYSRPPVRSEIWDISHCQRREISPIRTATNVSLSSFFCLPSSHPPSLALLSFSLSLFSSFPFFSAPTLNQAAGEALGVRAEWQRLYSKNQCAFGKTSGDSGLSMSPFFLFGPRLFTSASFYPHVPFSFSHFLSLSPLSLSLSPHLSLVQANICVRFVPISANVMQDASQSTQ